VITKMSSVTRISSLMRYKLIKVNTVQSQIFAWVLFS
jgi:hypothetical protein